MAIEQEPDFGSGTINYNSHLKTQGIPNWLEHTVPIHRGKQAPKTQFILNCLHVTSLGIYLSCFIGLSCDTDLRVAVTDGSEGPGCAGQEGEQRLPQAGPVLGRRDQEDHVQTAADTHYTRRQRGWLRAGTHGEGLVACESIL